MLYPEEFKARVKAVYPNWPALHRGLDSGAEFVGQLLSESSSCYLHVNAILEASSLEELQVRAKAEKEQYELYREWQRLCCEQFKQGNINF